MTEEPAHAPETGSPGEVPRDRIIATFMALLAEKPIEDIERTEIARRTGIGIASVYRVLADAKKAAGDGKVAP